MAADEVLEDTPNTKLQKQQTRLLQSQQENDNLKKQIEELQFKKHKKKKSSKDSSPKKKRRRVIIVSSSDTDTGDNSDSSSSSSNLEEDTTTKKDGKRSKTIISRSTNSVETPTMKSGMKYTDWVHWVTVWQHSVKSKRLRRFQWPSGHPSAAF